MTTRAIDISGKTFGLWTVVMRMPNKISGNSNPAMWLCRCECGSERVQEGNTIRRGKSKGCRSCTRRIRPYEAVYNLLVIGSKNRGLDCSLTFDEYVKFTEHGECHYCKGKINWVKSSVGRNGQNYNIDRMDSSEGYHAWNCVPCCTKCNKTKSNTLSYEEMVVVGKMRQFVAPTS